MINTLDLIQNLEKWEIALVCVDQTIETGTPMRRLLIYVLGALAAFEHELNRESVRDGMQKAKREGRPIGRPRRIIDIVRAQALIDAGTTMKSITDN